MKTRYGWLASGWLWLSCGLLGCLAAETAAERDQRMDWFREARFGMFIHWGVYAVPAGEWEGKTHYGEWFMEETKMPVSQYEKFAAQFNPVGFDARAWVRMAREAGMKYIVITSKHHDGFGLFRSDLTDWCIRSTPFQRDPLKELAEACREAGIRLCFYHSIMDWHHPDWGTRRAWHDRASGTPDMDRYVAYMKGQLRELLTRYGPIGILWFDGEWEAPWTHARGVDLYQYVRSLQPDIIVNNRVGKGRAGMDGMDRGAERVGDYGTPEQEIPATGFGPGVDWESCMTMNNHWGYNRHDQNWKSTQTLVRNLIDCASKGGNYLLNIGPTAEGTFPQASIDRLREIGRWMSVNSVAIYGTTASPFSRLPWGRCTTKRDGADTTLYLHVFDWPADGKLFVPGLKTAPVRATLLANRDQTALACSLGEDGLTVTVPPGGDTISTTVVLKFRGSPEVETVALRQQPDGTVRLSAADARLHGHQVRYETGEKRDNIGFWLNPADYVDWEFVLRQPGRFRVKASLAAPQPAAFEVVVGDQRLSAKARVTGDYGAFETVELGPLTLSSPGKVVLAVRPVPANWQPINLKAVWLEPE